MKAEDRLERAVGRDTVGDLEPLETKGVAAEAIALLRRCKDLITIECDDAAHRFGINPDWLEMERDLDKYLEGGDEVHEE